NAGASWAAGPQSPAPTAWKTTAPAPAASENCAASNTARLRRPRRTTSTTAPSSTARAIAAPTPKTKPTARRPALAKLVAPRLYTSTWTSWRTIVRTKKARNPHGRDETDRHESTARIAMSAAAADATTEMRTFGSRRPPRAASAAVAVVTRSPLGYDGRSREPESADRRARMSGQPLGPGKRDDPAESCEIQSK